MDSAYADVEGHFHFENLPGGEYYLIINDDAFYPVSERVQVNPDVNPYTLVQITLNPKAESHKDDPLGPRASGGNPYLVDPADYNKRFPKQALKAYKRGLDAEHKGNSNEAISRYLDALKIAPDYYPAHNNLGSLYLGKSDFKSAENQFREAIRLDQNEAQAYFNLANVLMLTSRLTESEEAVTSGLQRRPDSAFGKFLEGTLLSRSADYDQAEKTLREALSLDPTVWQAHLQLVNVFLQQGRRDEAIVQLQTFLKSFPSVPAVPKAKELLLKLQSPSDPGSRR
jgi:tetratricopeptide (TPR) repeat protein